MATRFGRQPGYIAARKYGLTAIADEIGVPVRHLSNCLKGATRPCTEIRKELPNLLGMPLRKIFNEDILEKPYNAQLNPWLPLAGA